MLLTVILRAGATRDIPKCRPWEASRFHRGARGNTIIVPVIPLVIAAYLRTFNSTCTPERLQT